MSENATVTLQWPNDAEFVDYQMDQRFPGEGVYEVPAKWEGHYRRRGWEDPPEDHDGDTEQPTSAVNRNMDGPSRDAMEGASSPDEVDTDTAADDSDGDDADDGEDGGGSGN